jgi:hypothetical protein
LGLNDATEVANMSSLISFERGFTMNVNGTIKDNKLILIVDLTHDCIQSKSAIAKALDKGKDPATVPHNLLATTAGFTSFGDVKVSLNVMKG